MIRFFFVGRRAAGRTRLAAQQHLLHVHGPMVVLPPADAGAMPSGYTQHHVLDGSYPATGGPQAVDRDLVTEFWFDSVDHLRTSTQTPYYLNNMAPDEPRFVDRATVEKLRVEPQMLRDGDRGDFKLLLFLSHRPHHDWGSAIEPTVTALADSGFGAVQINHTLETPMGSPFVDAVVEAWHGQRDVAVAFADRLSHLPIAANADLERSLALAVEVFTTERLRRIAAGQSTA